MSQKEINLPNVGKVILQRRKGSRNLRLSISPLGKVRVSMPVWAPFRTGEIFAHKNSAWISKHLARVDEITIKEGSQIGKSHRVNYLYDPARKGSAKTKVTVSQILLTTGLEINDPLAQEKLMTACEKALRMQSSNLLPQRLSLLSKKSGYSYSDVKIKKLTSRWGSCSTRGVITLSYYLMQLPWHLIDYVLLHELVHTEHMNHSKSFWDALEAAQPRAKALRKDIHSYKPRLTPL